MTEGEVPKALRKKRLVSKEIIIVRHENKRNRLRASTRKNDVGREKGQRDIRSYFQRGGGGFDYG